jgi:hypothetical protein
MAVLPPLTMTTTKMTTTMTMMVARVCAVNEAAITVPGGAHPPSAARGPAGLPSEMRYTFARALRALWYNVA